MFKDKNVLVTGGSGMIGRQVVKLLQEESAKVCVADKNELSDMEGIHYAHVDLRNYRDCLTVCHDMDFVFNLVGIKASPKIIKEQPADIFTPMLQFNTNMMAAAMETGVEWYLYTSSVGVYGEAEVFKEDDVWKKFPSKNDWYGGWSKRMGEVQDNFDTKSAMVIPSLIRKAHENEFLSVWGDGSPIRDFIYAEDVARGMLHMVKNKVTDPVNLGSGTGVTIKELAETIASELDREIKWDTEKPMGDKIRLFDTTRAESYGFKPSVSLKDGISQTIRWFLDNIDIIDKRYNVFNR